MNNPSLPQDMMNFVEVPIGSIFISVSLPTTISSRRRRIRRASTGIDEELLYISSTTISNRLLLTQQRISLAAAEEEEDHTINSTLVHNSAATVCFDTFSEKYGLIFHLCDLYMEISMIIDDSVDQIELQQDIDGDEAPLRLVLYDLKGSVWFQDIQQEEHQTSSLSPPSQEQVARQLAMALLESENVLHALVETSNQAIMTSSSPHTTTTPVTAGHDSKASSIFTTVLNSTVTINIYYHIDVENSDKEVQEEESPAILNDDNYDDTYNDFNDGSSVGRNRTTLPPSKGGGSPSTTDGGGEQNNPQSTSRVRHKRRKEAILIATILMVVLLLLLVFLCMKFKYKMPFFIFNICGRFLGYCCCCCCCCCRHADSKSSSSSTLSPPAAPSYSCALPSSGQRFIPGRSITSTINSRHHRPTMTPSSISFVYLEDDNEQEEDVFSLPTITSSNAVASRTTDDNNNSNKSSYSSNDNSNNSLHLWSKWNGSTRFKKKKHNNKHDCTTTNKNTTNTRTRTMMNTTSATAAPNPTASSRSSSISSNSPLRHIKFRNVMNVVDVEQDNKDDEDHASGLTSRSDNEFERVWEQEDSSSSCTREIV